MNSIPEQIHASASFNTPFIGMADYAVNIDRVAALYDAVTPDGLGAAAFVTALEDFARRHNLTLDAATRDLHLWLNMRADIARIDRAATFGGV